MPFLVDKGVTEELLAVWNVGSALWYRLFLVFANSFILKACCIPKILSLFQQQFWRSLLTSEITCLNDFVMLIPALTTLSTGVKFTVNWNITRAQEFCYKSLTLFIWSYIFACSLRNTSVKNKTKQKKIQQYLWSNISHSYLESMFLFLFSHSCFILRSQQILNYYFF